VSGRKDEDIIIHNSFQLTVTFLYISFALFADLPSYQGWGNPELLFPVLTNKISWFVYGEFCFVFLSPWNIRKISVRHLSWNRAASVV
jgi:hypothetical protein